MKPEDYIWIRRWGAMMHSGGYYITAEQEKAAEDNAPAGATFKREGPGWHTIEEVTNRETQLYFLKRFDDCPKGWVR